MSTHDLTTRSTNHAGPREWGALVVLMLPVLLISIDNTVLTFALPQVSSALEPTGTQLMWLVDIYPLMLAGFLVAMGSLGDRLGRRKLLMVGAAGFGLVSIIAAYSPDATVLMGARALLGFFGATLMPSTLSLIRNIFIDRRQRQLAIAVWGSMFAGGAALGPIMGGWLLAHAWWGSIFLINVPIIAVFLVAGSIMLPESRDPHPGPVDMSSIILSLLAMLPLVMAMKEFAAHGLNDVSIAAAGGGATAGFMFLRRQRRLAHPMIDLTLFKNRVFAGALTSNLLSMMAYVGFLFFAAQFLQLVVGLPPMDAALALVPGLVSAIICGFIAVWLVRFVAPNIVVGASFAFAGIGYAVAAFTGNPGAGTLILAFILMGVGIGLAETLTNDLMLDAVPAHKAGAASALSETAYEIGAVLGVAILGSVLTLTYRANLELPAQAYGPDQTSFETLGGTMEQAAKYPNMIGEHVQASAVSAFDTAVQHTSAVAIVIVLLAALVAWRTLPSRTG